MPWIGNQNTQILDDVLKILLTETWNQNSLTFEWQTNSDPTGSMGKAHL